MGKLSLPDRATIANMLPEYGATMGFFPVDQGDPALYGLNRPLARASGPGRALLQREGLFHTESTPDPDYTETLELDMGTVLPSIAGPKRPQDRIPLGEAKSAFWQTLDKSFGKKIELDASANPEYVRWLGEGGRTAGSLEDAPATPAGSLSAASV